MAARIRNVNWNDDENLKTELERYVRGHLQRQEILDFMKRDFSEYA